MIRVLVGLRYRFSEDAALQSKVLLDQIRSVLLLRLDEIGDVVLTTPLASGTPAKYAARMDHIGR